MYNVHTQYTITVGDQKACCDVSSLQYRCVCVESPLFEVQPADNCGGGGGGGCGCCCCCCCDDDDGRINSIGTPV